MARLLKKLVKGYVFCRANQAADQHELFRVGWPVQLQPVQFQAIARPIF
jgi:hypothetical protein